MHNINLQFMMKFSVTTYYINLQLHIDILIVGKNYNSTLEAEYSYIHNTKHAYKTSIGSCIS